MRGKWNMGFGLVCIVGGLSGKLALIGTDSGLALAGIGVLMFGYGGYQALQSRAAPPEE